MLPYWMLMRRLDAGDFRTRCYLECVQMLLDAGRDPQFVAVKATEIDPPAGPEAVCAMVLVTWRPNSLTRTYSSRRGKPWTSNVT